MKMKLFAAAVAALAAGGAYAQSSVTLYGVVDTGVEWVNKSPVGATSSNPAGTSGSSRVAMQSGNLSGSRWGLRGVEDLGGGLKGIFNLESGFNLNNGASAQGRRLFGRNAYVGLQGQWGQLTLGRQQSPFYDFGLIYDPMAISTRYSITSQDQFFAQRTDNSVKYVGTFGGLGVSALYSFNNNGSLPGSLTNTNRQGYWECDFAVGSTTKFTVGLQRGAHILSNATAGVAPTSNSLFFTGVAAAITSISVFPSAGNFDTGSEVTVLGIV